MVTNGNWNHDSHKIPDAAFIQVIDHIRTTCQDLQDQLPVLKRNKDRTLTVRKEKWSFKIEIHERGKDSG